MCLFSNPATLPHPAPSPKLPRIPPDARCWFRVPCFDPKGKAGLRALVDDV